MYKNKDAEQSKKYRDRRNAIITQRLIILFAVAVAAVIFFISAMNIPRAETAKLNLIAFIGLMITGALFIITLIFFVRRLIDGVDESDKTLHSKNIFAASAFFFFAFVLIFFKGQDWIPFLTALAIAATALVYLFYLYQREFFWFAFFTAACCFMLYFAEAPLLAGGYKTFFKIALAAAAVVLTALAFALMKNKGRLKHKRLNIKVLEHNAKYFQFFILAAIIAVFAVMGFIPAALFGFFYLICAVLACFIIIGVYFTVKII